MNVILFCFSELRAIGFMSKFSDDVPPVRFRAVYHVHIIRNRAIKKSFIGYRSRVFSIYNEAKEHSLTPAQRTRIETRYGPRIPSLHEVILSHQKIEVIWNGQDETKSVNSLPVPRNLAELEPWQLVELVLQRNFNTFSKTYVVRANYWKFDAAWGWVQRENRENVPPPSVVRHDSVILQRFELYPVTINTSVEE